MSLWELEIAISGLDTSDQVSEVQDRAELRGIRLPRRASELLEHDIRGKTIPKRRMNKLSGPRLRTTISWISRIDGGQNFTYRHQGPIKCGDELGRHMPDNVGVIRNPDRVGMAAGQKQGPQVGEGVAILEDADDNLGRDRCEGAGGAGHCEQGALDF